MTVGIIIETKKEDSHGTIIGNNHGSVMGYN